MLDWARDTTTLWIKNKGAGHTTTESDVLEESQILRLNNEINEMRDYYNA